MKLYATYGGIETWFLEFTGEKSIQFCKAKANVRGKYYICPFCAKAIKEGHVILLVNNLKLFPNIMVHGDCCAKFNTKEDAVRHLYKDYRTALKYKHWFDVK